MKRAILTASVIITVAAACQVNYDKTPSGLVYKIYADKGGEKLKAGEIVKFTVGFTLTDRGGKKDSALNETTAMPNYMEVDTGKRAEYSFMEVLPKMSPGDSAVIIISVDSLKSRKAVDPNDNAVFVKGSSVRCDLKVLQAFKSQDSAIADYHKEIDAENERQVKSVEKYMQEKGIKGEKTKSGAYVAIEKPGEGIKADSGNSVTLNYKGYLESNGQVFDTNLDSSKGHFGPIHFTVGARRVIQAWEESLPYFAKGGKGKILVPAFLGYGSQGSPPDIPPYSNLVFDIEVLDVSSSPQVPLQNTPAPTQKDTTNK